MNDHVTMRAGLLEAHGAKQEFGIHDAILIAAADGDTDLVRSLSLHHPEALTEFTELGRQQENGGQSLGSAGISRQEMSPRSAPSGEFLPCSTRLHRAWL